MKKILFITLAALCCFVAFQIIRIVTFNGETSEESYAYVEQLKGLGCLTLGETSVQVHAGLSKNYRDYKFYIKEEKGDHNHYIARMAISKDLIIDNVHLYFWKDTLYKIEMTNNNKTREIGEALVMKYGAGEGYQRKTASKNYQYHRWGNDFCTASYKGHVDYRLNDQGIPCAVDRMFQNLSIELRNKQLHQRINEHIHYIDSIALARRYQNL